MHEWFWPSSMASCNPAKPTATSALRDQAGAPCGRRLHAREIAETMIVWALLREYWEPLAQPRWKRRDGRSGASDEGW
jgi:hypothetical protein